MQKSARILISFLRGKQIALKPFEDNKIPLESAENLMKDENKFLTRSRERESWRKKLVGGEKKEAKAKAIFFRPNLSDDRAIRELAEMMGETKNAIVEKLVAAALHNKTFTTQKIEEQKTSLRRLEDKTQDVADNQLEIVRLLEELRRESKAQERLTSSLLGEIYCMAHTAVSLVRTALLQILGIARENQAPPAQVLASFDETSDLTIARSLQDLESAAAYHQIKPEKFAEENLFWKTKLRKTDQTVTTE